LNSVAIFGFIFVVSKLQKRDKLKELDLDEMIMLNGSSRQRRRRCGLTNKLFHLWLLALNPPPPSAP
jgi:hypothetical protein